MVSKGVGRSSDIYREQNPIHNHYFHGTKNILYTVLRPVLCYADSLDTIGLLILPALRRAMIDTAWAQDYGLFGLASLLHVDAN